MKYSINVTFFVQKPKQAIKTCKNQTDFQIFLLNLVNKEMKFQIKIPLFTKLSLFDYINNKLRK